MMYIVTCYQSDIVVWEDVTLDTQLHIFTLVHHISAIEQKNNCNYVK